ncbi:MAG: GIY-YIG nuclease family protein [Boseongicola sp. SB0667_bin_21]|nr:GIY-YIG nuclease family protein [Boseongicola sp. SB0667_bin_21]
MTEFTADMHGKLRNYVYRLIDPRDGSTFYVGKGQGDRVFDHVNDALKSGDADNLRLETIRKLLGLGLKPLHVIHRHGMSPSEARLAEAVPIDAFPGLANVQAGAGSNDFGPANAEGLAQRYGASEMQFKPGRKVIVFRIHWPTLETRERREGVTGHDGIYEAVRGHWGWTRRRRHRQAMSWLSLAGSAAASTFPRNGSRRRILNGRTGGSLMAEGRTSRRGGDMWESACPPSCARRAMPVPFATKATEGKEHARKGAAGSTACRTMPSTA